MAIETVSKEIDGVTYRATQIPAMKAVKLLNRIGRVLGPTLAKLGGAVGAAFAPGRKLTEVDVSAIDFSKFGEAVELLFEGLDDETTERILRDLLAGVSFEKPDGSVGALFPDSRTVAFDQHFTGRVLSVGKVALFAFETSFGGFSDALAALVERSGAKAEAKPATLSSVKSTT